MLFGEVKHEIYANASRIDPLEMSDYIEENAYEIIDNTSDKCIAIEWPGNHKSAVSMETR